MKCALSPNHGMSLFVATSPAGYAVLGVVRIKKVDHVLEPESNMEAFALFIRIAQRPRKSPLCGVSPDVSPAAPELRCCAPPRRASAFGQATPTRPDVPTNTPTRAMMHVTVSCLFLLLGSARGAFPL